MQNINIKNISHFRGYPSAREVQPNDILVTHTNIGVPKTPPCGYVVRSQSGKEFWLSDETFNTLFETGFGQNVGGTFSLIDVSSHCPAHLVSLAVSLLIS